MKLDHSFEEVLSAELATRHAGNALPSEFQKALAPYQTAQVIDTPGLLEYGQSNQPVETELEHVVRAYKRPSLLIKNGIIEDCASERWKEIIDQHRSVISASAQSVGRIELKNHGQLDWAGTGVLIEGSRVVTNRHVAAEFIRRDGEGFIWKTNPYTGRYIRGRIDFIEEYQNPNENEANIIEVEYLAPEGSPDIAILKIGGVAGVSPLPLATTASKDTMIVTVGYPWKDSRVSERWEEIHRRIFNDIYGIKRAAPGKILQVDSTEFGHDCSTLGGNSGSACVDITTGEVLGIHYGGQFVQNAAVSATHVLSLLE